MIVHGRGSLFGRLRSLIVICAWVLLMGAAAPVFGEQTVQERLGQYGPAVAARWAPYFKEAGVSYPPRAVTLIGLKEERLLEVYAAGADGAFRFVRCYPILAASGEAGPKLREGDMQVPEGLYRIESLNPNSRYHLSLRVNYPNEDDLARAAAEKRSRLGGDIMIHGGAASAGCLAMGDEAAEDLFVLAALVGVSNIEVILSPVDFRERELPQMPPGAPRWTAERYAAIHTALARIKKPPSTARRMGVAADSIGAFKSILYGCAAVVIGAVIVGAVVVGSGVVRRIRRESGRGREAEECTRETGVGE